MQIVKVGIVDGSLLDRRCRQAWTKWAAFSRQTVQYAL